MHIAFVVASRGFFLQLAEYDPMMAEKVIFRLMFFWKQPNPVRTWSLHRCEGYARFMFETYRKGRWTGWRFRGPVERIEHA